ncbi:MAG TPA: MarR family winged helix-turn-helix transcriptional regulator [Dyella sp.]|uniref:MarR family winged helix-turn-helix transcriptional regulator n=1 Tax=Dyella sp. TaxID=1869338 RepID=UPI002C9CE5B3|nr:MarR family winged helix-turn-helix transcriptional regulator [Dyella sp.]HTV83878.1 MarR family winged helix-turn-helix transcriptional regulator [Dyella sp.]
MKDKEIPVLTNYPTHALREAYLKRFPIEAAQRLETVFTLRVASQQIINVLNGWLEGTAGSPTRFQTLALLWGAGDRPVPHQEIIAALQVKRATVSAMMYSLEQEGMVQSVGDQTDRRRLLATLTEKGRDIFTSAMDLNARRLAKVFADVPVEEMVALQNTLMRMRDRFVKYAEEEATS